MAMTVLALVLMTMAIEMGVWIEDDVNGQDQGDDAALHI